MLDFPIPLYRYFQQIIIMGPPRLAVQSEKFPIFIQAGESTTHPDFSPTLVGKQTPTMSTTNILY